MWKGVRKLCSLGLLLAISTPAFAVSPWTKVAPAPGATAFGRSWVDSAGYLVNEDGDTRLTDTATPTARELKPECGLNMDVSDPGSPAYPFSFWYQEGDLGNDDLVVFHSGGGACWEHNTCGSWFADREHTTYFPVIPPDGDVLSSLSRGIFDTSNLDNPYRGASKIYINYCTADIGWGNKDAEYWSPLVGLYTVHHHGYANIRAVTEWLKRKFEAESRLPSRVLVAGISAGGYAAIGVLLAEVSKLVDPSETDISLIGDSANGIVTDRFLSDAANSWGFTGTLPTYVQHALAGGAGGLPARMYLTSINQYPGVRFSQYQNAFDLVQAQFYNIMRNVDDPLAWNDPDALSDSLVSWTLKMRVNTLAAAVSPAYRRYTAAGYEHGVLQYVPPNPDDPLPYCSDDFAAEDSGVNRRRPVYLTDWARDMFNGTGRFWATGDWVNATCFPNCNVPPPESCYPTP